VLLRLAFHLALNDPSQIQFPFFTISCTVRIYENEFLDDSKKKKKKKKKKKNNNHKKKKPKKKKRKKGINHKKEGK